MEALRSSLKKLNQAKIIVCKGVNKLIQLLEKEKLIVTTDKNQNTITVVPTAVATGFLPIVGVNSVGKKKLAEVASRLLPSISGNVILTTKKGLMTHYDVIQHRIGGQVIGIVY